MYRYRTTKYCRFYDMVKRQHQLRVPTVLQTEMTECGAACLSMILQYYGQYASLEELRIETNVSRDGCSAGNIVRAAANRGLGCEGFNIDIDQLTEITPPSVLWWADNHFVVFEGTKGDEYFITDPAYGRRKVDRETMSREFSGIVLTFTPEEEFRKHESYGRAPETYLKSVKVKNFFGRASASAAGTMLTGVAWVFVAVSVALLLRRQIEGADEIVPVIVAALIALFMGVFFRYRKERLKGSVEVRRSWPYVRKAFNAPLEFIEDRYPEDMVRSIEGNDRVNRFTTEMLCMAAVCAVGIVVSLLAMAMTEHRAVLPIIIATVISIALQECEMRIGERDRSRAKVLESNLARTVFTDIGKRETIRNTGQGRNYLDRVVNAQNEKWNADRSLKNRQGINRAVRILVYFIGIGSSFLLAEGIVKSAGTVLSWSVVVFVMMTCAESLVKLRGTGQAVENDFKVSKRIRVIDSSSPDTEKEIIPSYRKLQGNVRCENVSFGYGNGEDLVIENLDLDIAGGSLFVITGGNGCGKSTLGKLLGGLLLPVSGEVRYDGRRLQDIPDRIIFASIASVKQKSTLFPGSIRDNITMWNPHITQKDVDKAIRDACAEEFIAERETGIDTVLGPDGTGLSGGEQQRIEIARVLATNPSIVILDEAFSAVDDQTTLRIVDNIRKRGCTCIMMTRDIVLMREGTHIFDLDREGVGI